MLRSISLRFIGASAYFSTQPPSTWMD